MKYGIYFLMIFIFFLSKIKAQSNFDMVPTITVVSGKKKRINTEEYIFIGNYIRIASSNKQFSDYELADYTSIYEVPVKQVKSGDLYIVIVDSEEYLNKPHLDENDQIEYDKFLDSLSNAYTNKDLDHYFVEIYSKKDRRIPEENKVNLSKEVSIDEGVSTRKKISYYYRIQLFSCKGKISDKKESDLINDLNEFLTVEETGSKKYPMAYLLSKVFFSKSEAKEYLKTHIKSKYKDAYVVEYKKNDTTTRVIETIRITQ